MYGIKDGIMQAIPQNSYLKDGSSVSNYDLLDVDILADEGWSGVCEELPVVETIVEEVYDEIKE